MEDLVKAIFTYHTKELVLHVNSYIIDKLKAYKSYKNSCEFNLTNTCKKNSYLNEINFPMARVTREGN